MDLCSLNCRKLTVKPVGYESSSWLRILLFFGGDNFALDLQAALGRKHHMQLGSNYIHLRSSPNFLRKKRAVRQPKTICSLFFPGTLVRRENTRSHSDLDMWNRLTPYVLIHQIWETWSKPGQRLEPNGSLFFLLIKFELIYVGQKKAGRRPGRRLSFIHVLDYRTMRKE